MKTFNNKILESQLIYKSQADDTALKAWPLKRTLCEIRMYEDVPCTDLDRIVCSTLYFNDGELSAKELASIMGFNVDNDFESNPKRYKDQAEQDFFDQLIAPVFDDELIIQDDETIRLSSLGYFSIKNSVKRIFYKAKCYFLQNFNLINPEGITFPFRDTLGEITIIKEKKRIFFYEELLNYDIQPKIKDDEKELVDALLLQTTEGTHIFSAVQQNNKFTLDSGAYNISVYKHEDGDFAIVYSKNGTVSEIASQLLNDSVNEKIKNIKIEWGYYLRLLNDSQALLNFDTLHPFEDIITWADVIKDQRFCWEDDALYQLVKKDNDANLWHEISSICPIECIKSYLKDSIDMWDWNILSARMDGEFIVANSHIFPWNYDIIIHNESVSKTDIESLLLDKNLMSVLWSWKELMPRLSDDFVIHHIDDIPFDLSLLTANYPESVKSLLIEYPDKSWNWTYISKEYDLGYILNNIELLAKRIDLGIVTLRAFKSEEYAPQYCNSEIFHVELESAIKSETLHLNANKMDLIWNDDNIKFFENIGCISWCTPIIGGFETNEHIIWDERFFSLYSSKITTEEGCSCVTSRIKDYRIINEHPDFNWNWEIISNKSDFIDNTEFVNIYLNKIDLSTAFWKLNSETFCKLFNRPELYNFLIDNPQTLRKCTELASIQLVKQNFDFDWDWDLLTRKTINTLKIDKLGDERWVTKWNWKYLSDNLDIESICDYLSEYADYWDWNILTSRLDKSFIIENLVDYADRWNWQILVEDILSKEDLQLNSYLPTIATILSVKDDANRTSLWEEITRKFPLDELINIIHDSSSIAEYASIFQWDLAYLYGHDDFNINVYVTSHFEDINWELLSKSKSAERLFYFDKTILSYDMWLRMVKNLLYSDDFCWDFKALSQNESINWNPVLLKIKKNQWDWSYLSENSKCFSEYKKREHQNKNIKQFKDLIDFKILSTRTDITFDDFLLEDFISERWDWQAISKSNKLRISNEFLISNQDKDWDWAAISSNQNIKIDKNLISDTISKDWDWMALSNNTSLSINLSDLLTLHVYNWDWKTISKRNDIEFDNDSLLATINDERIDWDWDALSLRNDIIFNESLLMATYNKPLNWLFISRSSTFKPTLNVLSKISSKVVDWDAISQNIFLERNVLWPYKDKLNWYYISLQEKFQKSDFIFYQKYRDYLDWSIISKSEYFSLSIQNLCEFKNELNWKIINKRKDFIYTNSIIETLPDVLDWSKASQSLDIQFSIDFVQKFRNKWNWKLLFKNPLIQQDIEKYELSFKDKLNGIRFIERFVSKEPKVYHFAHLFNAVNILRSRKILSRINGKGKFENSAGSNVHRRDTAHHYARFYYRPQTPTQYYNEGLGEDSHSSKTRWIFRGYDYNGKKMWDSIQECPTTKYWKAQRLGSPKCPMPVFFEFDLQEILDLCLDECYYSTGNMQMDSSQVVAVASNPNRLNTSNLYSTIEDGLEIYKAYSQQEFLVWDCLDFSKLNKFRIICYDEEQASLLKEQLGNDPICSHITTDVYTSSGINIFHRENRKVTIYETEDSISFTTNYRDPSSIVIESNELDKLEILDKDNIKEVTRNAIQAYPSISFRKTDRPVTVRFKDLEKYDNNSWLLYTNKNLDIDERKKYPFLSMNLIDTFSKTVSDMNILIDKCLFKKHMLFSYHGIAHTMRVMWNSYVIATLDTDFLKKNISMILYASLIHDLGKQNDIEGEIHGENSAILYKNRIISIFGEVNGKLILDAVKYHSIDDSKCPDYIKSNHIWSILKDADALDRSRFGGKGCNPSFLRNTIFSKSEGKDLFSFAQILPVETNNLPWNDPINEFVKVIKSYL